MMVPCSHYIAEGAGRAPCLARSGTQVVAELELAPIGRYFSVGAAALAAADMQVAWIDPSDGDLVNQERVVSQGCELT